MVFNFIAIIKSFLIKMKYSVYFLLLGALDKILIQPVPLDTLDKHDIPNKKEAENMENTKNVEDQSCKKIQARSKCMLGDLLNCLHISPSNITQTHCYNSKMIWRNILQIRNQLFLLTLMVLNHTLADLSQSHTLYGPNAFQLILANAKYFQHHSNLI